MKKLVIFLIVFSMILFSNNYLSGNDNSLAENVLRLHVIANSDSIDDQALKIEVKNQVVRSFKTDFAKQTDAKQAEKYAKENISVIKKIAEETIEAKGYNYPVRVEVGNFEFPTKSYGNMIFPQGNYDAVRIIIGEGKGKNWWCVLFPPLCMVSDSDKGISFDNKEEAKVSIKCLELIGKGVKLKLSSQ